MGKPIIYTRFDGHKSEIIDNNEDGLIIKPTMDDMIYSISYLLENEDVAEYLSNNAKEKALADYSWSVLFDQCN